MPRPMHLAQFLMYGPTYHSLAMWRHPRTEMRGDWAYPELYGRIARACERGKLDMVFFADFGIIFDRYRDSLDPSLRHAVQVPVLDPIPLVAWLAGVTSRIGLAVTFSVSGHQPYYAARLVATLDHLTRGRIGWNVVTTPNRHETERGHDEVRRHDDRYERADEFLEVCGKLWRSWEEDAVVMDRERGIFADPDRVRTIDHAGAFFTSRGPLNVPRSPQSGGVIIQAGASGRGRDFAAKHAEVIFAIQPFAEGAAAYYADVKERIARLGRAPSDCKILFGVQPFVAETEAAARAQQDLHNRLVPEAGALALLSGQLGRDFSRYALDDVVEPFETGGSQGIVDMYTRAGGPRLTGRDMALMHGRSVGLPQVVGTPEQVADQLEAYLERAGGDGLMLTAAYTPGAVEDFVDLVVPVLRKRGRFRADYAGATLRDHLRQHD
jgi:FMN-dependent oxidoreductase (nitrilotriacetate monooxygenase family)